MTLTCNLTSSAEVTWYRLRSDQPLPLLTVRLSKIGGQTVVYHSVDSGGFSSMGEVEQGPLSLEIQKVTEEDGGLYFCMGSCPDVMCVSRGILLAVEGEMLIFFTVIEFSCIHCLYKVVKSRFIW